MLDRHDTAAPLARDGGKENQAVPGYRLREAAVKSLGIQEALPGLPAPWPALPEDALAIPTGPGDVTLDQARPIVAAALMLHEAVEMHDPNPELLQLMVSRFQQRMWQALYPVAA